MAEDGFSPPELVGRPPSPAPRAAWSRQVDVPPGTQPPAAPEPGFPGPPLPPPQPVNGTKGPSEQAAAASSLFQSAGNGAYFSLGGAPETSQLRPSQDQQQQQQRQQRPQQHLQPHYHYQGEPLALQQPQQQQQYKHLHGEHPALSIQGPATPYTPVSAACGGLPTPGETFSPAISTNTSAAAGANGNGSTGATFSDQYRPARQHQQLSGGWQSADYGAETPGYTAPCAGGYSVEPTSSAAYPAATGSNEYHQDAYYAHQFHAPAACEQLEVPAAADCVLPAEQFAYASVADSAFGASADPSTFSDSGAASYYHREPLLEEQSLAPPHAQDQNSYYSSPAFRQHPLRTEVSEHRGYDPAYGEHGSPSTAYQEAQGDQYTWSQPGERLEHHAAGDTGQPHLSTFGAVVDSSVSVATAHNTAFAPGSAMIPPSTVADGSGNAASFFGQIENTAGQYCNAEHQDGGIAFYGSATKENEIGVYVFKAEKSELSGKVGDGNDQEMTHRADATGEYVGDQSVCTPSGYYYNQADSWQQSVTATSEYQHDQTDVELIAQVAEDADNGAEMAGALGPMMSINQPPASSADYSNDPSAGYFYDPKTGQYHATHSAPALPEPTEDRGAVPPPERARAPAVEHPSMPSAQSVSEDPLNRRKGCPIVTFGFGGEPPSARPTAGKVCVMFPRTIHRLGPGPLTPEPMADVCPGDVVITCLFSFMTREKMGVPENLGPLPVDGPGSVRERKRRETIDLAKRKANEEGEMAALSRDEDVQRRYAGRSLLWELLAIAANEGASGKWDVAARRVLLEEGAEKEASRTGTRVSPDSDGTQAAQPTTLADLGWKEPPVVTFEAYAALEKCLLVGDQVAAVQIAARYELWAEALLISRSVSHELFAKTTGRFIRSTLADAEEDISLDGRRWDGLRIVYGLMGGMGPMAVDELLDPPRKPSAVDLSDDAAAEKAESRFNHIPAEANQGEGRAKENDGPAAGNPILEHGDDGCGNSAEASALVRRLELLAAAAHEERSDAARQCRERKVRALQSWKKDVALILSNQPTDSAALTAFGDALRLAGLVEAAHFCYMLSPRAPLTGGLDSPNVRIVLVGADHTTSSFHREPDALLRSEILEFALTFPAALGSQKGGDVPLASGVMPHLQAYKVAHAWKLCECGLLAEAMRYCEASLAAVRAGAPALDPRAAPGLSYCNAAFRHALRELYCRIQESGLAGGAQDERPLPSFGWFLDALESVAGGDGSTEPTATAAESGAVAAGRTPNGPPSGEVPASSSQPSVLQQAQNASHSRPSGAEYPSRSPEAAAGSTQEHGPRVQQNGIAWYLQQPRPGEQPAAASERQDKDEGQHQESKPAFHRGPPAQTPLPTARTQPPSQQPFAPPDYALAQPRPAGIKTAPPMTYLAALAETPPMYAAAPQQTYAAEPVDAAAQPAAGPTFYNPFGIAQYSNPYENAQFSDQYKIAQFPDQFENARFGPHENAHARAGSSHDLPISAQQERDEFGQTVQCAAADAAAGETEDLGFANSAFWKSGPSPPPPAAGSEDTAQGTKGQDARPADTDDKPEESKLVVSGVAEIALAHVEKKERRRVVREQRKRVEGEPRRKIEFLLRRGAEAVGQQGGPVVWSKTRDATAAASERGPVAGLGPDGVLGLAGVFLSSSSVRRARRPRGDTYSNGERRIRAAEPAVGKVLARQRSKHTNRLRRPQAACAEPLRRLGP
ncbi:MAG: Sec23-binding domain of Sec16-domain-containing protein [Olpidium bornovanus]|uniref:Protein transport protein sec16 n=1 Tax=Olpidium bornovanus TaxID=278681 RepID=A0A8H8A2A5_9FUNG|nr:MAG: Sec23-binding domain of Sec16-domain-containing protein [Olpidium bornovanus]